MISVNGTTITEEAIARELQYHPATDMAEAAHNATTALVIRQALLDAATTRGILARAEDGESEEEAKIRQLLAADVPVPAASEAECRRYFEHNPEKFAGPPIIEARHILLGIARDDEDGRRERRAQAEVLIDNLRLAPGRFGELAQLHSDCPSKSQDGNLGQLSKGSTVPEFEKQLLRLPEGLCPYPLESRYGYHVVFVERYIAGKSLEFDQARPRIADYLSQKAHRAAIRHYIQRILAESEISGIELELPETPLTQ
ncbi:MAG: peptidylprolyl isomerase [Gammaproteobacteria bacterium]|nr:peptidylprolyl isomerase [Gammaproteobacteria bacterium]